MFCIRNLDLKYFWSHFEKQDGCHGRFLSVIKSAYISLIIGPRGLGCKTNQWKIMGLESFGVL